MKTTETDTQPDEAQAEQDRQDSIESLKMTAAILGWMVLFAVVCVVGVLIVSHFVGNRTEALEMDLSEKHGVTFELIDRGRNSWDMSTWSIDGEERLCKLSDDELLCVGGDATAYGR